MKRKKKKGTNKQQNRQEQRASFNHFCRQIHHYLKLIDCGEVGGLFDKKSLFLMYKIRSSNLPKVRIGKGVVINSRTKKELNLDFEFFLSETRVKINDNLTLNAKEVLLYLTLIHTNVLHKEKKSIDINNMKLIQMYYEKMPDFDKVYDKATIEVAGVARFLSISYSRMNANICWLEHLDKPVGDEDRSIVFELKEYIPKKQTMMVDRNPRPVYPISLAITLDGPKDISIPAWRLRLPKESNKLAGRQEYPVYFQNHLLHRLEERLDCLPLYMSQLYLYVNMQDPKFVYFKGQRLVEIRIAGDLKLGYIVLEFHKDRFLAKTFLLLTNFGTPEGDRLKEISRMEKCDFQYWAIDKLSTFRFSDLKENPKTRDLFERAGCGDLLKDMSVLEMDSPLSSGSHAKKMLGYLKVAKDDEEMLMAV